MQAGQAGQRPLSGRRRYDATRYDAVAVAASGQNSGADLGCSLPPSLAVADRAPPSLSTPVRRACACCVLHAAYCAMLLPAPPGFRLIPEYILRTLARFT